VTVAALESCTWARRSRRVGVLLVLLLVCASAFGLSARAEARAARDKPTVLAVWGLADGDTPVAGATVRVFAGGPAGRGGASRSRRALAQTNGRRGDRTYRSGVTLLAFRRLPREFVVEVRGGRAGRRSVPGTLRAAVRGYRSGDVIYVNPVTTMMAAYRAAVERGSLDRSYAGARRLAYRELRIPHWMSQADLSYTDRRFDGDRFLAAARRAGGVGALIRRLLHDDRAGRRFSESRRRRSRQAAAAQQPLGPVPEALLKGLAGVALRAMVTGAALGAGEVAQRNQIEVPGWLLGLFGLGDASEEQFAEIRRLLEGLSAQVTRLQSDVNLAGFSALVHQTDRTTGQIDHANSQLVLLANMPSGDPTKRLFAQTIVDYIGTNLLDAPEILNQNLGTRIALADNLIKSASRTLGQRKFFGPKSSAEVRGIYNYFAAYQVQLAMLLQEYYHAKPNVYSPTNAAANLERLRANVVSQADSLKPDVPDNTVIDTKSREMWLTDLRDPEVPLRRLAFVGRGGFNWVKESRSGCGFRPVNGPIGVAGVPYCDWELPTQDAYERLIEGWSGASPSHWLRKEAGFSGRILSAFGYKKWINRDYSIREQGPASLLGVNTFDLYYNRADYNPLLWGVGTSWESKFDGIHAGLMYKRRLGADESYWWSN
jgi:hypothetical protein